MNYKHILGILFTGLLLSCNNSKEHISKGLSIKGNIKGIEQGQAKLLSQNLETRENLTLDSVQIEQGNFELNDSLDSPRALNLMISKGETTYYCTIMAENSAMKVTLDTSRYERKSGNYVSLLPEVEGSTFNDEYHVYKTLTQPYLDKIAPLSEAYDKLNDEYIKVRKEKREDAAKELGDQLDQIKENMEPFYQQMDSVTESYISNKPDNNVSSYLLSSRIATYGLEKSTAYYEQMNAEIQNGYYGRSVKIQLDKLKKASPGATASLFAATDINGDELKLEDYRGQYVLLDFWASWCKPCRKGNPHLLKIYNKYHDKGFEIIGISDDDSNPDAWRKAVKDDGIGVWKHVLRGLKVDRENGYKILDSGISEAYDIHFLPTKILIDTNGVIIGRYGSEEEALDEKLKEIFEK